MTDQTMIDRLVEALDLAAGELDDGGRRVALATYDLLTHGEPVTVDQVAEAAAIGSGSVAQYLDEWAGVFRDRAGAVVGFWGLAISPLDPLYRLRSLDGTDLGFAWCAWDTLFLPHVLGRPLEVLASDGLSGDQLHLTVTPAGVARVEPPDAVVTFLVPEAPWEADIVTSFCHKVLFFTDRDQAARWRARQNDDLALLSVAEAFEVGRRWTAHRYGDLVSDQAVLASESQRRQSTA